MFMTLAPWRIISFTSFPGPSCSAGNTVIWTRPLVRAATFFAKYSAAWCAGSLGDNECAKRILMSCAAADIEAASAVIARQAVKDFMRSPESFGWERVPARAAHDNRVD